MEAVFGGAANEIAFWQLILRTLLIYVGGVLLVRVGRRRFMGEYSAFDMILGVTVGALLGTAAASGAVFANALGVITALIAFHSLLSAVAVRSSAIDELINGKARRIIREGELDQKELRRAAISTADLETALRRSNLDLEEVDEAYFERSGAITVCRVAPEARVVEVEVEPGVQRVRIEIASG